MSISIQIGWTPVSSAVSYTVGGNTYPYNSLYGQSSTSQDIARYGAFITPTNTQITFISTVIWTDTILKYKWDFGDGSIAHGPTVTHTFKIASPQQRVSLNLIDAKGRNFSTSKQLNLQIANVIQVGEGLNV